MFYKLDELKPGALSVERVELVERIEAGLKKAEIVKILRRHITVELPSGERINGDVAPSGFTVYLGGFDWVTFKSPAQVLQKFPQFMPLPQTTLPKASDSK